MDLPAGLNEKQFLDTVEQTVRLFARKFSFGIYDRDDIEQEARLECLKVISKYDFTRPLQNYLYTCIYNFLVRLKRDKLRRNDPPCLLCHHAEGNRSKHEDGQFCKKYLAWKRRNDTKASLMRPVGIDEGSEVFCSSSRVAETAEAQELLDLIDTHLDVDLRATYLKMLAGKSVPKARRLAVQEAVRAILGDAVDEPVA